MGYHRYVVPLFWEYLFFWWCEGGGGDGREEGGVIILPPGTPYSKVCLDPCSSYFFTNIPYCFIYFKIKIWSFKKSLNILVYKRYAYASLGFKVILYSIYEVLVHTSYSSMLKFMIYYLWLSIQIFLYHYMF